MEEEREKEGSIVSFEERKNFLLLDIRSEWECISGASVRIRSLFLSTHTHPCKRYPGKLLSRTKKMLVVPLFLLLRSANGASLALSEGEEGLFPLDGLRQRGERKGGFCIASIAVQALSWDGENLISLSHSLAFRGEKCFIREGEREFTFPYCTLYT